MSPLTEAQKALAADPEWIDYARRVVSGYVRRYPHLASEFASAAMYGLVRAASDYGADAPYTFRAHVRRCVRSEALEILRHARPKGYRRDVPEDEPLPTTIPLGEPGDCGEDPVGWELVYHDELEWLSRLAGDPGGDALRLYYGHAATADLTGLGAALGCSTIQACRRHKQAEAHVRRTFAIRRRATVVLARKASQ